MKLCASMPLVSPNVQWLLPTLIPQECYIGTLLLLTAVGSSPVGVLNC